MWPEPAIKDATKRRKLRVRYPALRRLRKLLNSACPRSYAVSFFTIFF